MFPLPEVYLPNSKLSDGASGGMLNGVTNFSLGSDESLGGALLTPIPWLRDSNTRDTVQEGTSVVGGSHFSTDSQTGSSSINGVATAQTQREAGAVTQGELLRQEQEAGVIPVTQVLSTQGRQTRSATASSARAIAEEEGAAEDSEQPHARGPDVVGVEDMGPQERGTARGGFDVEAALGRSVVNVGDIEEGDDEKSGDPGKGNGEGEHVDEDVVITDADGKTEEERDKTG